MCVLHMRVKEGVCQVRLKTFSSTISSVDFYTFSIYTFFHIYIYIYISIYLYLN